MELLSAGESGLAREQAEEILRQFPDEMNSQFVVAAAIRAQGHEEESLQRLKTLTERAPDFALAQQELGFAYAATGRLMAGIQRQTSTVERSHTERYNVPGIIERHSGPVHMRAESALCKRHFTPWMAPPVW